MKEEYWREIQEVMLRAYTDTLLPKHDFLELMYKTAVEANSHFIAAGGLELDPITSFKAADK